MEISHIECNSEYKEALQLVNCNTERLKDTLTKEQLDLLLRYSESRNELSNITELGAFKTGFPIGAGFVIASIN